MPKVNIMFYLCAFFLVAVLPFAACSSGETKPDFAAAEAAKAYYDSLAKGGYDYFTRRTYRSEHIPDTYAEQLVANTKMYWRNLCSEHGGIAEIRISDCRLDSTGVNADAFLLLCFADSTKEEIVVHMENHDDVWWMK